METKETTLLQQLDKIEKRYEAIDADISRPEVLADLKQLQNLAQERAGIHEIVSKYREYRATLRELEETRKMAAGSLDSEMAALVKEEIASLEARADILWRDFRPGLLPKDPNDQKDTIMEIRAGTGGDEAALFAADLFRMYSRYAQAKGWPTDIMSCSESGGTGGFKEIIFEIRGKGAFSRLKYERGVHRVQRIPVTESSGRVHTSTATVVVLPKAEEVDIEINPGDIKLEFYHAGSAGGQNVNKVATAVRLTHTSTGMVVTCQDERSQLQNRLKAMAVMRSRLLDIEQRRAGEQLTQERRAQVGSADRSEKIRTYNFPQDRMTDHRFGLNFHNLPRLMDGQLDEVISALIAGDEAQRLAAQFA